MPTATASSTSSIAATASCCSRSRSCSNLTWASGIGADGRPIKLPNQEPTPRRHQGLSVAGRRDQLVLAVLQSRRPGSTTCRPSRSAASTRRASRGRGRAGKSYLGGIAEDRAGSEAAAHPQGDRHPTGAIKWELPQTGAGAVVGRHADDRERPRDLRRGWRRADGGRRGHRHSRCGASRPTRPGGRRR